MTGFAPVSYVAPSVADGIPAESERGPWHALHAACGNPKTAALSVLPCAWHAVQFVPSAWSGLDDERKLCDTFNAASCVEFAWHTLHSAVPDPDGSNIALSVNVTGKLPGIVACVTTMLSLTMYTLPFAPPCGLWHSTQSFVNVICEAGLP